MFEDIKLVILDIDGVVRDSSSLLYEGLKQAVTSLGFEYKASMEDTVHMRMMGKYIDKPVGIKAILALAKSGADLNEIMSHNDAEKRMDRLVAKYIGPGDANTLNEMMVRYDRFYGSAEGRSHVKIYPNAEKAVRMLRDAGLKLGVVSAAVKKSLERDLNIASMFDVVLSAQDVKNNKPDPEGLFKVMEQTGVTSQQTVFIGDAWADIQAAKRAKCYSIGIATGLSPVSFIEKEHPDLMVQTLYDAAKVILNGKK